MSAKQINAVLVKLSIGIFPNQRQDRAITEDVKQRKALGEGAGKWVKYKLPDQSLTPIREFAGFVRRFHYDHTTPWDEGVRMLSRTVLDKWDKRMKQYADEFWNLTDEFGEAYPKWIEQAKSMHAGTFDPTDYPQWAEARNLFKFGREVYPIPQATHFNSEMQAMYGAGLEAITEKKIQDAVADTWNRLIEPVQKLAAKLASPDAVFRDTLIENVQDMVKLVPALNLTGDTQLADAAKVIQEQLSLLNLEQLRTDKVVRKDAAEKAAAIAARFGAIGSRKLAA